MGKSNLFRYLLTTEVRKICYQDEWQRFFIVGIDSNALGRVTEESTYQLLVDGVIHESQQHQTPRETLNGIEAIRQGVASSADPLIWKNAVRQVVQLLIDSDPDRQIIFAFDQFDGVYKTLPGHFFANLRSIRDQHKYRISYLTFTREELLQLCSAPECEEFYELLSPNIIGLGPYSLDESRALLQQVSSRYRQTLLESVSYSLIELSAGHPGILKAMAVAVLRDGISFSAIKDDQVIAAFLSIEDVKTECAKLYHSLADDEKRALRVLSSGEVEQEDLRAIRRLKLKKLVTIQGTDLLPFSPILTRYLAEMRKSPEPALVIQAGPIRINSDGEVWVYRNPVTPSLTKKEFLLLRFFCLEPGRLSTRDEVIANVYQDEYLAGNTVSDDALNALVRRLRERIEPLSNGRCRIATIRGRGYRLEVSSSDITNT
jgi:DNA-binding winged helix-turn-helix (wHTH) protein